MPEKNIAQPHNSSISIRMTNEELNSRQIPIRGLKTECYGAM